MIKIRFDDEPGFRLAYIKAIKSRILIQISFLLTALEHARGLNIKVTAKHSKVKKRARSIVNAVRVNGLPAADFEPQGYVATLTGYRNTPPLRKVNLDGIFNLMTHLSSGAGAALEDLLLCDPDKLFKHQTLLMKTYQIDPKNVYERAIIQLAFNYKTQAAIANAIRKRFKDGNLMHYCPYCNQGKSKYIKGNNSTTARGHQLDHFFDKATYPLLGYSLYNLVPGDPDCNALNKGSTPFSDKWHLNPYIAGYTADIMFKAKLDPLNLNVKKISFDILTQDSKRIKQLVGNNIKPNVDKKHGNINVFEITAKYDDSEVRKLASTVVTEVRAVANNIQSIDDILKEANLTVRIIEYTKWYWKVARAAFEEKNFHLHAHSKLFRDLHDEVFKQSAPTEPALQKILDQRFL